MTQDQPRLKVSIFIFTYFWPLFDEPFDRGGAGRIFEWHRESLRRCTAFSGARVIGDRVRGSTWAFLHHRAVAGKNAAPGGTSTQYLEFATTARWPLSMHTAPVEVWVAKI